MKKQTLAAMAIVAAGLAAGAALLQHDHGHDHGHDEHDGHEHGHDAHVDDEARDRVVIAPEVASDLGLATAIAGPAQIREVLPLTGVVRVDPLREAQVVARFPGVVTHLGVKPFDRIARGALLARVQSDESLQEYDVTAPIGGVVTSVGAQPGGSAGREPLFTIVDASRVWIELDVFEADAARLAVGQSLTIHALDGAELAVGRVDRLAPTVAHGSQTLRAITMIDNAGGRLRPGQFVRARVALGGHDVPLAVAAGALQRHDGQDVVFAVEGDAYVVRPVVTGATGDGIVEIRSGLAPGARYVSGNSYVIKADLEKSGASHDH